VSLAPSLLRMTQLKRLVLTGTLCVHRLVCVDDWGGCARGCSGRLGFEWRAEGRRCVQTIKSEMMGRQF
jgi:hypothetical protein